MRIQYHAHIDYMVIIEKSSLKELKLRIQQAK